MTLPESNVLYDEELKGKSDDVSGNTAEQLHKLNTKLQYDLKQSIVYSLFLTPDSQSFTYKIFFCMKYKQAPIVINGRAFISLETKMQGKKGNIMFLTH